MECAELGVCVFSSNSGDDGLFADCSAEQAACTGTATQVDASCTGTADDGSSTCDLLDSTDGYGAGWRRGYGGDGCGA